MSASVLADTGALLAVLDRDDAWHRRCSQALAQFPLPLLTSQAVLTELFYFVGRNRVDLELAWAFCRSGAIALASIDHRELPALHALMAKYQDRPMDFADATLVHLAERESINTIFTVDFADFDTYRIHGRRRFRVLPKIRA